MKSEIALVPGLCLGMHCGDTKIVVICNPNNPTGTTIPLAQIVAVADAIPKDALLLVEQFESLSPQGSDHPLRLGCSFDIVTHDTLADFLFEHSSCCQNGFDRMPTGIAY
jgi:hypothetical protein